MGEVTFKRGDKIHNITWDFEDARVFEYIGAKGYGAGLQYVFWDDKEQRCYHFTEYDKDNWELYVPGFVVGKKYRYKGIGNRTYTILMKKAFRGNKYEWVGESEAGFEVFFLSDLQAMEEVTDET